jgi:hypothetical protein
MVDIVARIVVEDDGSRTLNFKSNEVIFGGGRLKGVKATSIPLDWNELMKVYESASESASESAPVQEEKPTRTRKQKDKPVDEKPVEQVPAEEDTPPWEEHHDEEVKNFTQEVQQTEQKQEEPSGRRTRKPRSEEASNPEETKAEEQPATRTRKRRSE